MLPTLLGWVAVMGGTPTVAQAPPTGPEAAADTVATACGADLAHAARRRLPHPGGWLAWAPSRWPVPLDAPFAVDLVLCAAPGQPLPVPRQVDADMPAHRHGMNYRPTLRPIGPGRYRAEGLFWHMAGRWRLRIDLAPAAGAAGPMLRLEDEVEVE